jgi:hypothetical protein
VVALEELARLGIELQLLALLVQRIDAREQRRVEMNRIVVCRQLRREVGLDLQNRLIAVGIGQTEESILTRLSTRPVRSIATMVLSKLGGSGL